MRTRGGDSRLLAQEGGLRRKQPRPHLGFSFQPPGPGEISACGKLVRTAEELTQRMIGKPPSMVPARPEGDACQLPSNKQPSAHLPTPAGYPDFGLQKTPGWPGSPASSGDSPSPSGQEGEATRPRALRQRGLEGPCWSLSRPRGRAGTLAGAPSLFPPSRGLSHPCPLGK